MKQLQLFENDSIDSNFTDLGKQLRLEVIKRYPAKINLYCDHLLIKTALSSDKVAKKILVTEAVELGANQTRLSQALNISRQTIHNYCEIKKAHGIEGLIHGYSLNGSQSKRVLREQYKELRPQGNKAQQMMEIRRNNRESAEKENATLSLSFEEEPPTEVQDLADQDQLFYETHDWEESRYAGAFIYWPTLQAQWNWMPLILKHFGNHWRIFSVFMLMTALNIRSIEQLKNIASREAGLIIGLVKLPSKPIIWEWFYQVADMNRARVLLKDYFSHQIRAGLVSFWLWFTDGHLLPYTGKAKVHYAYNTQRRMPVPGRTSQVTTDTTGRIIDFEIQEGKGDLRQHISSLGEKWQEELPAKPLMVFDREGYSAEFFSDLIRRNIPFATWDKNIDATKLAAIEDEKFTENFEFNGKKYRVFEESKTLVFKYEEDDEQKSHSFTLRHIHLWNQSSHRKTCGLAWNPADYPISLQDFTEAILSRWGASENAFKHIQTRHPFHYQPGFKLTKSQRQDIANPEIKKIEAQIKSLKNALNKDYKKLTKTPLATNKNGTTRIHNLHERLKQKITDQEQEIKQLQEEKRQLPERVNVSELEDYKTFNRIADEGKYLFDFVTTSVWNARKEMIDYLRSYYGDENDLVDLFYAITSCRGWIKNEKEIITVRLEPLEQPKRRLAQERFCRKLTGLGASMPNGKWLVVEVGDTPLR